MLPGHTRTRVRFADADVSSTSAVMACLRVCRRRPLRLDDPRRFDRASDHLGWVVAPRDEVPFAVAVLLGVRRVHAALSDFSADGYRVVPPLCRWLLRKCTPNKCCRPRHNVPSLAGRSDRGEECTLNRPRGAADHQCDTAASVTISAQVVKSDGVSVDCVPWWLTPYQTIEPGKSHFLPIAHMYKLVRRPDGAWAWAGNPDDLVDPVLYVTGQAPNFHLKHATLHVEIKSGDQLPPEFIAAWIEEGDHVIKPAIELALTRCDSVVVVRVAIRVDPQQQPQRLPSGSRPSMLTGSSMSQDFDRSWVRGYPRHAKRRCPRPEDGASVPTGGRWTTSSDGPT